MALSCVAVGTAGCGASADGGGGGGGAPQECQDVRLSAGDGGLSVASGWDDQAHAYGQAAPLLVCIGSSTDRRVTVTGSPGTTVTPPEQLTGGRDDPVRFEVTASAGTSGTLTYAQYSAASGRSVHEGLRVLVAAGDDGWRFRKPD